jgi:hypothetical protein
MWVFDRPGARFLARCALLCLATVSLWYFALLGPILEVMRVPAGVLLRLASGSSASSITVEANGDWKLAIAIRGGQVPSWLSQYIPADRPNARAKGIQLTVERMTLGCLTLSLPLYWALALATHRSRTHWRALAFGTAILAVAAFLFCAIRIADSAALYLWGPASWIGFPLKVGSYAGSYAVPYVAPFMVAVWLLPELRRMIVPWEAERKIDSPTSSAPKLGTNRSASPQRRSRGRQKR